MSVTWDRVVHTTLTQHAREVEENTLRNHKFLAKLKAKGRIEYGNGGAGPNGDDFDWRVKFGQGRLAGLDDSDVLTFERIQRYKRAYLPWRGYSMQDAMSDKEYEQNSGPEALIKYFSNMGELLLEDAEEQIHDEFFVDGNASGNSLRIHGIESFMGDDGAATAGTMYVNPTGTYAGLRTDLGYYGGSWVGSYPNGQGSSEYDFWSPKLLNWSSTGWGTGSTDWEDNCNIVLRRALIQTRASKGRKGAVDTVFMDRELYAGFLDLQETKERLSVQRGQSSDSLVALGFNDVVNYDGADVTSEWSIPSNTVYGLNFDYMQLKLLNKKKQLFRVLGPHFDMKTLSYLLAITCYGNLKCNPRAFFKLKNYA